MVPFSGAVWTPADLVSLLPDFHRAGYDRRFDVAPKELEVHMERVEKMGGTIRRLCEMRIGLYRERTAG